MTNDHRHRVFLPRVVSLSLLFFCAPTHAQLYLLDHRCTGNSAAYYLSIISHFAYSLLPLPLLLPYRSPGNFAKKEKLSEILPAIFRPHRDPPRETVREVNVVPRSRVPASTGSCRKQCAILAPGKVVFHELRESRFEGGI